jgi:hypothetical protein
MADSAASTQSRTTRASSTKRRVNTVSTETENKLARAARSAQRLAQLSDASRDDSTLDLFPDDPTRATLEAMNIDIRQGTLHGFELPDVVLAAVGATTSPESGAASGSSEARAARRSPREKADSAYATVPLAGFERIEPTQKTSVANEPSLESEADADGGNTSGGGLELEVADGPALAGDSQTAVPVTPTLISPSMAAATLVRDVTRRREAVEPAAFPSEGIELASASPQRFAASFAKSATASFEAANVSGEEAEDAAAASAPTQGQTSRGEAVEEASAAASTEVAREAAPTGPELDRARATAFADTVDALYGVISDQRRAATDHSRRMKWMLSIVVGALLMTVAIGITQTVLLMRLTRETTAQQHRIEQLMQTQQAAMTSLLDAHLGTANAVADSSAGASAPSAASMPPVTPHQTSSATAPASKRKAHTHAHKPKAATAH